MICYWDFEKDICVHFEVVNVLRWAAEWKLPDSGYFHYCCLLSVREIENKTKQKTFARHGKEWSRVLLVLCQGLRKGRGCRMEMLEGWMDIEITLQSPILSLFYPKLAPGLSKSTCMEVFWIPRDTELAKMQHFDKGNCGFLDGFWFEIRHWGEGRAALTCVVNINTLSTPCAVSQRKFRVRL